MPHVKITNLFHAVTTDFEGNGQRLAGWSESWYTTYTLAELTTNGVWSTLCRARARLMPKNVSIVGGRWQEMEPKGAQQSFDTVFRGSSTASNDHPSMALQWTVRSTNSPNQRSVQLRGTPDARVLNGEYVPTDAYNQDLLAYFNILKANWKFWAIDRTIEPIRVVSITAEGVLSTLEPHGLAVKDKVRVMSVNTEFGRRWSQDAIVASVIGAQAVSLYIPQTPRNMARSPLINSTKGKIRKLVYSLHNITITNPEIINPTPITYKAGRPFKQFRGRRTGRR